MISLYTDFFSGDTIPKRNIVKKESTTAFFVHQCFEIGHSWKTIYFNIFTEQLHIRYVVRTAQTYPSSTVSAKSA